MILWHQHYLPIIAVMYYHKLVAYKSHEFISYGFGGHKFEIESYRAKTHVSSGLVSFRDSRGESVSCFYQVLEDAGITWLLAPSLQTLLILSQFLLPTLILLPLTYGFLWLDGGSVVKNPPAMQEAACSVGDVGLVPGSGRSPGEINVNLFLPGKSHGQRTLGGWGWATVHGVARVRYDLVTKPTPWLD